MHCGCLYLNNRLARINYKTRERSIFMVFRLVLSFMLLLFITAGEAAAETARQKLLKHGVNEIVFAARRHYNEFHWYANFGYFADNVNRKLYYDGGGLYKINLKTRKLVCLVDATQGTVRDPQVHYSGQKILFSYRKKNSTVFHLYEIDADGSNLKQLTYGKYDDIEPSYLPDDRIVFISSRARRWVNCWTTQVGTLHTCDNDGSNIREISSNIEHDNTPWPLPDGRILYTRWE